MEENSEQVKIFPNIIIPTKDFLVGSICGFNAAKKKYHKTEPEVSGNSQYIGYWLEISCHKCGRFYSFDSPNDLPTENLICETKDCGNYLIVYGIQDIKFWRIGPIEFT